MIQDIQTKGQGKFREGFLNLFYPIVWFSVDYLISFRPWAWMLLHIIPPGLNGSQNHTIQIANMQASHSSAPHFPLGH